MLDATGNPCRPPRRHFLVQSLCSRVYNAPRPLAHPVEPKKGPAILIQDVSTVVVEPGCTATVSPFGDVSIEVGDVAGDGGDGSNSSGGGRKRVKRDLDPVYLSIFAHRFMGIAEQMGRTLQVWYSVRRNGAHMRRSTNLELLRVRPAPLPGLVPCAIRYITGESFHQLGKAMCCLFSVPCLTQSLPTCSHVSYCKVNKS